MFSPEKIMEDYQSMISVRYKITVRLGSLETLLQILEYLLKAELTKLGNMLKYS